MNNFGEKVSFIWSVADLLRGPYRPNQYKDVMLPLTVLRRLDCVLEPTKQKVLERAKKLRGKVENKAPVLKHAAGQSFYNTSKLDFPGLLGDSDLIADNLRSYIARFSPEARDILEKFEFDTQITRLDKADLLYLVISKFCEIDLHPEAVSNLEMGYLYEELIRRFSELSNETAGEHDLCRVHVNPSNHPVDAKVTVMKSGQHQKQTAFYIRQNNATREITDEAQKQKYIAQRWG